MAAREAKFLWKFLGALDLPARASWGLSDSVDLFTDSMGVVALSRNAVSSSATKHIEIADFFVRELVERGVVTVAHVPTASMVADALTKPLSRLKFFKFMIIILGTDQFDFDRLCVYDQSSFAPGATTREGQHQKVVRGGTADKDAGGRRATKISAQPRGVADRSGGSTNVAKHPQSC